MVLFSDHGSLLSVSGGFGHLISRISTTSRFAVPRLMTSSLPSREKSKLEMSKLLNWVICFEGSPESGWLHRFETSSSFLTYSNERLSGVHWMVPMAMLNRLGRVQPSNDITSTSCESQRAELVRGEHIRLCTPCPALPNAGNGILFDQLPSRSTLEKNVQHIPHVQFAFGSEMQVSQPLLNSHRAHMLKRVLSPLLFYPIVKEALGSSSSLNTLSGPGDFTH